MQVMVILLPRLPLLAHAPYLRPIGISNNTDKNHDIPAYDLRFGMTPTVSTVGVTTPVLIAPIHRFVLNDHHRRQHRGLVDGCKIQNGSN